MGLDDLCKPPSHVGRFAPAGAILRLATTVKIWGLVPLAVVCVYAVVALGVRRGLAVGRGRWL